MTGWDEQLALLRRRIARIDQKYAHSTPPAPKSRQPVKPERYSLEGWLGGKEIESASGKHFEVDKLYERHRRHGSVGIVDLECLPSDLLDCLAGDARLDVPVERWAFLDTETTGLAGGTGTYAFLVGVGSVTPRGFLVRQFFMREQGEEASLLETLGAYLAAFDVLVTYNGKTYDQPLLETRYRMARFRPPFERLVHVDLLFGARRLWKLRYESCRLMELESQVLGVERQGDLPGEMIPYVYFDYLRTREAERLLPVFHHNAVDILTLACLTAIVPGMFRCPGQAALTHGAEMVGLARWLEKSGQREEAVDLLHRAVAAGLRDDLLFRTMWDAARLERRLGRLERYLNLLTDLAASPNAWRVAALEALAKHAEHLERDYETALRHTMAAREMADLPSLRQREERLRRKVARHAGERLL